MANRSIIYIDGFNLYYGAVRGTPYKWLNLERFFKLLRTDDDIHKIHYFTAIIEGPTQNNQLVYLRALDTLPLVNVVLGKFKMKQVRCRVHACAYQGDRVFGAPEEKRTDVNIALHMLHDAYEDRADRLVVVSGDSDLVPAVTWVKTIFPDKQVIVYVPFRNPRRGAAVELRSAADRARWLPLNLLQHAQFRQKVPDGAGAFIHKPETW